MELVQKRVCRIILGHRYGSYAEALTQLKLCSLYEWREHLLVGFGQRLIESERHSSMLPGNKKAGHGRNLRNANQLDPPRCRTARYQNSAISFVTKSISWAFND